MTPGAYLRECREAAGMSVDDLSLCLNSEPPVSARRRAELLQDIEAGSPIGLSTAFALAAVPMLGLDIDRLAELVDGERDAVRLTPIGRTLILQGPRA